MRWQYKLSILLLLLSQIVFLGFALYHTDKELYIPYDRPEAPPSKGYSWIWYHIEDWSWSLVLALVALAFFVYGVIADWKTPDNTRAQ
jgi:hypothetical protein